MELNAAYLPMSVDGTIDKPDQVACPRFENSLEPGPTIVIDIRAVDEPVVQCWWSNGLGVRI